MSKKPTYDESSIQSLDWKQHIRQRPGMYIGKLGNGKSYDDGIYVLIKEIIDNSIDEYVMGYGKKIDIRVKNKEVIIRDFGRGIPLGKVIECVSQINTGAKYDSEAFKRSIGLNGVGTKAVNALSEFFKVSSIREGEKKEVEFSKGETVKDYEINSSSSSNGTKIQFIPDSKIFGQYDFHDNYIEERINDYVYLNSGLSIKYNGKVFYSKNGLRDLLESKTNEDKIRYPIIHLKNDDIEIALTHSNQYGEEYHTFVNGQNTIQGGTHLSAFKEALTKTIRDFYKKDLDAVDIRASIISAISIKVQNPIFESQTKTKLGSLDIGPKGPTLRVVFNEFLGNKLDNYLHKNPETADALLQKILQSEKERKELAGIRKIAAKRNKKANLHNKKLRDCKLHYNDKNESDSSSETTIFITEGDSASGSITKVRNVRTQAVFSLRGKPLNTLGMKKRIVYENEEFNLLQHALNLEDGIEGLRYNKVVIATDADVDGMHIRLLLITFFIQFFPDLIKKGHLYILETPLFRVRNKKETIYCYSNKAMDEAKNKLSNNVEITRFKGLGEISPSEFKNFINEDIKLEPILINKDKDIADTVSYYMGKNTQSRQDFIIKNLKNEESIIS
ncbi:MAG: DNA topoisomerase IV [Candidatus Marinimicrobia bacterium]|nr:DNA topoisomerase IV [Candidatus Neomarinimicrobiota bacterium]